MYHYVPRLNGEESSKTDFETAHNTQRRRRNTTLHTNHTLRPNPNSESHHFDRYKKRRNANANSNEQSSSQQTRR